MSRLAGQVLDALQRRTAADLRADVDMATRQPRRQLPGAARRGRLLPTRLLVADVLELLIAEVKKGSAQAEVALAFFPRIFLRREASILVQMRAFAAGERPLIVDGRTGPRDREAAWVAKLVAACEEERSARLLRLLADGPSPPRLIPAEEREGLIDGFFSAVQLPPDEKERVSVLLRETANDSPVPLLTGHTLRAWARAHRASSGGATGWTGKLLAQLDVIRPSLLCRLAEVWSRPPVAWQDPATAAALLRGCDGWLLPQAGKPKPRPIAAPQVLRRIRTAADARRVAGAIAEFAAPQGQLGCSGDAELLAYSLISALVVACGGTAISADRSASFQSFHRSAVLDAVERFVAWAKEGDHADAAAALVRMLADVYADDDTLPLTSVHFSRDGMTPTVAALAQGCSLSPLLEALILCPGTRANGAGVLYLAAHDDLQLTLARGATLPAALPDTSAVGGSYNAAKSLAVGSAADAAVAADLAGKATLFASVWGRPVGDVGLWLEQVWLPRFRRTVTGLRTACRFDPEVAIVAAHRIRGPGVLAQHWLRGLLPGLLTPNVLRTLRTCDDEWVALWGDLAGHSVLTPTQRAVVRAAVFGSAPGCLGHESAELMAPVASARAMASCARLLYRHARDADLDTSRWGPLLLPGQPLTSQEGMQRALEKRAREAEQVYAAARAQAARPRWILPGDIPKEGLSLWELALRPSTDVHAALPPWLSAATGGRSVRRYAAARVLGLPLWPALAPPGTPPRVPSSCSLCGALPSQPLRGTEGTTAGAVATHPSKELDLLLDHAGACRKRPRAAGYSCRHDDLCKASVSICREAGIDASYCNASILRHGTDAQQRLRPADWIEHDSDPRHPLGVLCDITIVGGGVTALQPAIHAKERRYASALAANPMQRLQVLAISTDGFFAAGTTDSLNRWASRMSITRFREGRDDHPRATSDTRSAFGFAFAAVMLKQAAAWFDAHESNRLSRLRQQAAPPISALLENVGGNPARPPQSAVA